ncbi:hypothetical protein BH23ACT2_BH23ACT2_24270 [soil metagenome]
MTVNNTQPTTTTPAEVTDRATAAVLAIPAPAARRLLEMADYVISIRGHIEELLAQLEEMGQVLDMPDTDAQDPDYDVQNAWWNLTGQSLVCNVLREVSTLLDRQGLDGDKVEPYEVRTDEWRAVKAGPLATAAGPFDPDIISDPGPLDLAGASASEADVRPGQRHARPGEVCTCGDPAVVVYETARFGDVGHCGVEHRGNFS